ncbi:hypothetical protein A3A76_03930 [Candidatus Woesebacteria bacterium RIFCSPLOWO2_01_FULL_39_23]|uniref:Glycosyltransferase RgtA/B/C/D-like domain-containing protein n=1 Tax=Candidatus Woesebacteria bacterium RIFCSPHIGHO2_01_FULL_40_22 TaxID=1802499 RepID=A0A1F7YJY1_9BACT|nr:MAG: hypothetical protein A2141_00075 [Candidatus Woesebacteria bacterium RBG_16_40_11]OGM27603.1 MAG: hypothetical protein A2628_02330 [Candidatus Woesebacteria bacterium RIFCSPHIGHO2_01_FULL_40_22]OGM36756.1 MAG: hypothetical protein A3E41_03180 [Candidatus Woesebacteria bacterium RIFCSPHIGHO2_12_FULL_38_9]OGM62777.1 MAG: hypothetical protein A3A76_03930 [Candidatus Woesebacteria bacterium RIFCSPLOWO2_01_FULL_39_23]
MKESMAVLPYKEEKEFNNNMDIIKYIKKNRILIIIILVAFFLRIYKVGEYFMFEHDQDLASWFVKDVLVNKHLRLIGQETSTQGVFIGPLYYYLLVPFYYLFNMHPLSGVIFITILSLFSLLSVYFVFTKMFNRSVGLITTLIYAVSYYTIYNDRQVVPTTPVITWSVWYLFGINLLLKGKQKQGFIVLGILLALIWHLNFSLILLAPLIPISLYVSRKKIDVTTLVTGLVIIFITSLPLIAFEFRHNFNQVKGILSSLTSDQHDIISGFPKFQRVIYLTSKNAYGLLMGNIKYVDYIYVLVALVLCLRLLIIKKVISKKLGLIFIFWLVIYITFFTFYSKIVSEYYLNGMMVVWIAVFALGTSHLLSLHKYRILGIVALLIFTIANLYKFFTVPFNKTSYPYRRAIVAEIKKDSLIHGYPCVAVSYITKPGYDLGYRYLFYVEDMHVNKPDSLAPVYTIVYPLNDKLFPVDKTFGAIGLIYPEYSRYTDKGVEISCSGENSNLTDPMFGFTN